MTLYEIISAVLAVAALIISIWSLIRTHRIQNRQLEFQAIAAALAKKQLGEFQKGEQVAQRADVTADLVKAGATNYRFVITNDGPTTASEVTFEIDLKSLDNPLVQNEAQDKLPYPSLRPGQSFTLIAALDMASAMAYDTHLTWRNPDGSTGKRTFHLSP